MSANQPLPLSLRERLNDRTEVAIFEQWRQAESSPLHPILAGNDTYFESQRTVFVPRQPYHDLEEVIAAYVKDNPISGIDVKKCTWHDVSEKAQAAEQEYNLRDANNRARSWIRNQGTSLASNLAPLKEMFPDEYGLTVVAGGLYLIFTRVCKISENRDRIFQFFDEVPTIISQAEKVHKNLPRDLILDDRMTELRQSVVLGLCGLLRILQPSYKKTVLQRLNLSREGSRKLDSIFQVESTANRIDEMKKAVQTCKSKFDDCADGLRTRVLKDLHSNSERNLRESKAIRQTQHATLLEVKEMIGDLKASREQYAARWDEAERIQTQNSCYILLQDALRCANVIFLESPPGQNMAIQAPEPAMVLEDLLSILNVDPKRPIDDLIDVTSQRSLLETDTARLVNGALTDDTFRSWLTGANRGALLIEDFGVASPFGVYSPISVLSGMLTTGLPTLTRQDQKARYVSCFFCSLHSDPADSLEGPSGMLRSLIAQLVHSVSQEELGRFNLSFISADPHMMDSLTRRNIASLCDVYCSMILQLSRHATVFCIIDEVSNFETDEYNWRAEIYYIARRLRQLANRAEDGGPTFKLAMTSSSKTLEIYQIMLEHECVSIGPGLFVGSYLTDAEFQDGLEDASAANRIAGSIEALNFGVEYPNFLGAQEQVANPVHASRPRSAGPLGSPRAGYAAIYGSRSYCDLTTSLQPGSR